MKYAARKINVITNRWLKLFLKSGLFTIRFVIAEFNVCDKIEETITNSLKQAEALRQSILKKAFEGKLL